VRRLLDRQGRRPTPILIVGETGTGKTLLARALHRASLRQSAPFVEVNCAAIPDTLLEAELFGFEQGAFTDARRAKPGLVQTAHHGTLLLDEVGLLPPPLQAKLLTVLEERRVRRLGGTRDEPVDLWLMAATNADLAAALQAGRFRADLYHRLAVVTIRVPPLRERGDDVLLLAEHLLAQTCAQAGQPPRALTPEARTAIRAYGWPGNVRELANVLERVTMLSDAPRVTAAQLGLPAPGAAPAAGEATPPAEPTAERSTRRPGRGPLVLDRTQLVEALHETGWNLSRAAARLGIARNTLRTWMEKHRVAPATGDPAPVAGADAPHAADRSSRRSDNLPRSLTSFVGREGEMATVQDLLARTRLLTLTGAGGSGKTRLAVETAAGVAADYPDGVWLVELGALTDPALVPHTVAAAVGVHEEAGIPLLDTLTAALRQSRLLLLLDNCEHLLVACAHLTAVLLQTCAHLRVLATSREPLDVPGEVAWRVPPLSLPAPEQLPAAHELMRYEAIHLFVERARAAQPGFALTDRNALAVAQVCFRLDGIPLAIELAAARLDVLTVEQINGRLHDRFGLLAGGRRTWLPRQQTLRATMDWSHELLSGDERILLRRLAVFTGVFSLAAAEAVGGGPDVAAEAVLDLLAALIRKSLVIADVSDEAGEYRLLETVRAYALEKLRESGEEAAQQARHRDWYVAFAERAERMFEAASEAPQQARWLDRLEAEYDNLRAALALRDPAPAAAETRLRLGAALWRFWEVRGRQAEGRAWLEAILAESPATPSAAWANALNGAGNLARNQGDHAQATAHHEAALAVRRALGDARGVAASLNNLGVVAHDQGDFARAVEFLEQALPIWSEAGSAFGMALSLNNLGRAVRFQGDYARATALGEQSLGIFRDLGHTWGIARALNSLGDVARYTGATERAVALYEESLRLRREVGDKQGIAVTANNLGDLARDLGHLERATLLCEESLALRRDLGDGRGVAIVQASLGLIARDRGDYPRAAALLGQSLATRRALDDRSGLAWSLEALGSLAAAQGAATRAARLLGAAEALREAIGAPLPPAARPPAEEALRRIRSALDEEAVAAAWGAGRAMGLPQALAEASE